MGGWVSGWVGESVWGWCLRRSGEGVGPPRAGVTGYCALPGLGSGV